MRKTYLSLSVSRTLSSEFPIGDPHGGPAYGERGGPVVSLVATIAAIVAAPATGGLSLEGLTLMQGISLASSAIGVVGMVTGNKMLSEIGAVGGLAAGVVSLTTSFGNTPIGQMFGDSAGATESLPALSNVPGSTADAMDAAANGSSGVASNSVQSIGPANMGGTGGYTPISDAPVANTMPNLTGNDTGIAATPTEVAVPAATGNTIQNINPGTPIVNADGTVSVAQPGVGASPQVGGTGAQTSVGSDGITGAGTPTAPSISGSPTTGTGWGSTAKSVWDNFNNLNPSTKQMIAQGLMSAFPSSQVQSQTGLTEANAALLRQQLINNNYATGAGGLVASSNGIIATAAKK